MSKSSSGLFSGTKGSKNKSNSSKFQSNIDKLGKKYKLAPNGKFGEKGKNCQIIKSKNQDKTAKDFFNKLTKGFKKNPLPNGKGKMCVLDDKTIIVFRPKTSTPNSPAVSIDSKKTSKPKLPTQKIHFIKEDK